MGKRTKGLTIRLEPEVKALADALAARENRSLTNLLETLIIEAAAKAGLKRSNAIAPSS